MLTINGETISNDLINEEFQLIKSQYERMGRVSCCERDPEFRGYAKENIMARVLINQEAEARHPEVSEDDISAALEKLVAGHGGRESFFANTGLTAEQEPLVREDVRCGLRVDRLLQSVWGDDSGPEEAAQRAWYEANHAAFMTPEEVRASHLFKHVERVEDRERIYQLLRDLRGRARHGADFDALALEHTDKEDKLVDLGWFKRGEFMEEFDLIIFSLDEGEISPVFASHWGFHLAKITGRRPSVVKPFAEVQAEIIERIVAEQRQAKTKALVDELKARAVIVDD